MLRVHTKKMLRLFLIGLGPAAWAGVKQDEYIRETVNGKVRGFSWDPNAEYADDLHVSDDILGALILKNVAHEILIP